jgi:glycosyltransferase involved in cell wall biosynthesis
MTLFSDVDFSPQLIAILTELENREALFQMLLIGNPELQIAKQIKKLGWELKIIPQRGKLGSLLSFLLVSLEIIKYRPHTLFASGQYATIIGIFLAKLLSVSNRVFIRHHSIIHHKYQMKLGMIMDRISNRMATSIIAVSTVVKNILVQKESVIPEKITVIYNGVDLIKFKMNFSLAKEDSIQHSEKTSLFHIGVISRMTEWKGVEYTASAFVRLQKEFPNSRLHIVGAFADSYTDVQNILSNVDSNRYTFEKSNSNIPLFLHGLDAFVHVPVGKDDEAFGIVYIEALASGIPCIFTQSGVLNELETPGRYVHLVGFRNSDEIYLNLKQLIQSKNESKVAVPESWLNQFSLDEMANRYVDFLLGVNR